VQGLSYGKEIGKLNIISTGLKFGGYSTAVLQVAITSVDIANTNKIDASDILNTAIVGISFIPGWGWIVGGVYFVSDISTLAITGKSIGTHLDEAIGGAIVSW
jgi:hypothetical protein